MTDEKNNQNEQPKPGPDKGNIALLTGAGIGTYGTTMALTSGFICPVCVVATPLFLGIGGLQRYKHLKNKKEKEEQSKQPE
jgi:chromate transport protein ChrA